MGTVEDVELLRNRLKAVRQSYVKAVILFGSRARGESGGRSDVDLLVLHEGWGVKDPVVRRRLYHVLREAVGSFEDITVVDMEVDSFLHPVEINSLLLNVYWDGVVVYDRTGEVPRFLKHVRQKIGESGLKRVKDGKAYRWILPEPLKEVKIL